MESQKTLQGTNVPNMNALCWVTAEIGAFEKLDRSVTGTGTRTTTIALRTSELKMQLKGYTKTDGNSFFHEYGVNIHQIVWEGQQISGVTLSAKMRLKGYPKTDGNVSKELNVSFIILV